MTPNQGIFSVPQRMPKPPPRQPPDDQITANRQPDVCDRCGAMAHWEVLIPTGLISLSLYFCNHHYRMHELSFISNGYQVRPVTGHIPTVDQR